ncbi:hypothetical protein FHS56_002430 [Thermonema lapsum]|uniref:Uncharacterized protein n=1 Tax=Thermonema lapsum TaxID=28195 RepID=A0A846MTI8_9BACT|nr:hypothetical protein [Thermonema lapsum]
MPAFVRRFLERCLSFHLRNCPKFSFFAKPLILCMIKMFVSTHTLPILLAIIPPGGEE